MFSEGMRWLSKAEGKNNVGDSEFQLGVYCFHFLGLFSMRSTFAYPARWHMPDIFKILKGQSLLLPTLGPSFHLPSRNAYASVSLSAGIPPASMSLRSPL